MKTSTAIALVLALASCAPSMALAADPVPTVTTDCYTPQMVRRAEATQNGATFIRDFLGTAIAGQIWDRAAAQGKARQPDMHIPPHPAHLDGVMLYVEADGSLRLVFFDGGCAGPVFDGGEDVVKAILAPWVGPKA